MSNAISALVWRLVDEIYLLSEVIFISTSIDARSISFLDPDDTDLPHVQEYWT